MRRQGSPTHEIHLPANPTILEGANRLGTDLPGQVHLQGAIDGHKMVELANDLGVVGVGNRVHRDHGIIIQKVHQAARPHDKTGNGLLGPPTKFTTLSPQSDRKRDTSTTLSISSVY